MQLSPPRRDRRNLKLAARTAPLALALALALVSAGASSCQKALTLDQFNDVSRAIPNDPRFDEIWGLKRIGVVPAWLEQTDCSATVVAVVDTGIDLTHEDLKANLWVNPGEIPGNGIDDEHDGYVDDINGWNFYDNTNTPQDDHFHGTHVSGIIGAAGNNGLGVTGVCWKARIMVVKVLGPDGAGAMSDVASGISYATQEGAKVINLSLGAYSNDASVEAAIQAAQAADILVAVAAGNDGMDLADDPVYPASLTEDNIVRVAAVDDTDARASFSNYGAIVDIAAPGVSVLSTTPETVTDAMASEEEQPYYDKLDGTSMATPYVAGAATLVRSIHPTWTYSQTKSWLLDNADSVSDLGGSVTGNRRLQLEGGI